MAEIDELINEPSDSQKRITQLSKDKKDAEERREAAEAKAKESETKAAESQRLAEFSDGFADIVADNPAAKEHKDEIKAKVMSGMSIEDAKFAVLGKAGKLNAPQAQQVETMSHAGGSASTGIIAPIGEKTIDQMTQEERRAALESSPFLNDILAPKRQ